MSSGAEIGDVIGASTSMTSINVARAVGRVALGPPINSVIEIAGPEQFALDGLIRVELAAKGDPREVISDPQIYTEVRAKVYDALSVSKASSPAGIGVTYYTHTVRAKGGTDTSTIVLQTVSAERFP